MFRSWKPVFWLLSSSDRRDENRRLEYVTNCLAVLNASYNLSVWLFLCVRKKLGLWNLDFLQWHVWHFQVDLSGRTCVIENNWLGASENYFFSFSFSSSTLCTDRRLLLMMVISSRLALRVYIFKFFLEAGLLFSPRRSGFRRLLRLAHFFALPGLEAI